MASEIQEQLLDFISRNFRIPKDNIDPEASLVDQGVIDSFGFIRGAIMAIWRVLRCNPLNDGGLDPVPERRPHRHRHSRA